MPRETTCDICGLTFVAKTNRTRYCSDICRNAAKRESQNKAQRKQRKKKKEKPNPINANMSFDDVQAWIQKHYKKTGVLLSYGKAVAKIEQEKGREKSVEKN